ncbi:MAG: (2Fe-2S)-binding protein [Acidobacteria bacterium]|nr:MAG: (2Fe-2S)-binding protein [Acidobacteriota bacterium]
MLAKETNELLCRVGPGTEMGDLMRQYWVPALRSDELATPDSAPVRVRLLGENLIAFRVTSGRVGLIGNHCPHRGASLFYGRNEEEGLRCVYHGWKFDVGGSCVDMPSEPSDCNFKGKVKAVAYPCVERGGVVWTYMGPRQTPPPVPDLEANMDAQAQVYTVMRKCNYMQALEGDIDSAHFAFLHMGHITVDDTYDGNFIHYQIRERAPRYEVTDTEFGISYGAYRPTDNDDTYFWRIGNFLCPFYTQVPLGPLPLRRAVRAWVPMDDEHTMSFNMVAPSVAEIVPDPERLKKPGGIVGTTEMLPDTTDWYGRSRLKADIVNDHLLDRERAGRGESYTGLPGLVAEDHAVTESMGSICDRSQEHLGTSDVMIIRTRLRLIRAAQALRTTGEIPPGVDNPEVYRQRAGGVMLPRSANWFEATKSLRTGFAEHAGELASKR